MFVDAVVLADHRGEDYWQSSAADPSGVAARRAGFLNFQHVTGIEPISDRSGASPAGTVPDALEDVLFAPLCPAAPIRSTPMRCWTPPASPA